MANTNNEFVHFVGFDEAQPIGAFVFGNNEDDLKFKKVAYDKAEFEDIMRAILTPGTLEHAMSYYEWVDLAKGERIEQIGL